MSRQPLKNGCRPSDGGLVYATFLCSETGCALRFHTENISALAAVRVLPLPRLLLSARP